MQPQQPAGQRSFSVTRPFFCLRDERVQRSLRGESESSSRLRGGKWRAAASLVPFCRQRRKGFPTQPMRFPVKPNLTQALEFPHNGMCSERLSQAGGAKNDGFIKWIPDRIVNKVTRLHTETINTLWHTLPGHVQANQTCSKLQCLSSKSTVACWLWLTWKFFRTQIQKLGGLAVWRNADQQLLQPLCIGMKTPICYYD